MWIAAAPHSAQKEQMFKYSACPWGYWTFELNPCEEALSLSPISSMWIKQTAKKNGSEINEDIARC